MNPLFTIGHSTRAIDDFIALLRAHGIGLLLDVRTVPRSRHNPQYEKDALAASLARAGIDYEHVPALGGLRHPRKDSINVGWHNESFRGYADYMQTPEFHAALDDVLARADAGRRIALMCAEGAPFRCHRSLISDAVLARGREALEIASRERARAHRLTPFAKVERGRVTYPTDGAPRNPVGRVKPPRGGPDTTSGD